MTRLPILPTLLAQAPQGLTPVSLRLHGPLPILTRSPQKTYGGCWPALSETRPVSVVILDGVPEGWAQTPHQRLQKRQLYQTPHGRCLMHTGVGWSGGRMGSERSLVLRWLARLTLGYSLAVYALVMPDLIRYPEAWDRKSDEWNVPRQHPSSLSIRYAHKQWTPSPL